MNYRLPILRVRTVLAAGVLAWLPGAAACTGHSILGKFTANTHPVPAYNDPYFYFLPGGAVYHRNRVPGQLLDAPAERSGRACSYSVLYMMAWGDSSLAAAMDAGGIARVHSVEHEIEAVFGFIYHSHCTIVHGAAS